MINTLFIRDLIVYGILIAFILYVTKQNNMWGNARGTSKTKVDVRKSKSDAKKRSFLIGVLKKLEYLGLNFGFEPSERQLNKYKYNILRGRLKLKLLDRNISPLELVGLFKVIKFIGLFFSILFYILTHNILALIGLIVLGIEFFFNGYVEARIMSEDQEIEEDFPDLYLLLYSRLIKGAQVRLAPTLDEYLKSIDVIHGEESHKAMRNFVQDLRNYIEIYGDDSMAIHKMREMYKSAMLVNFFNLAIQSLRGVDNKDKLLAFKIELSQKRVQAMTDRANKLVERGQKVIWAIFIILGQFIVLSWVAKAGGTGAFGIFDLLK